MGTGDGVGTHLNLDAESDAPEDGVWRASITWDPETSNLPEPETEATGPIPVACIDVDFHIMCSLGGEAPLQLLVSTRLLVKQILR